MTSTQKPRAHLIANKKSGKGRGETLADEARTICDELGYDQLDSGKFFAEKAHRFIRKDPSGWSVL